MVNAHYPRRLLIKALNVNAEQNANEFTVFPKILKSSSDKNALVIMPFYGNDAVGKNIDTKIATLKSRDSQFTLLFSIIHLGIQIVLIGIILII
jgi:hypothetical protein